MEINRLMFIPGNFYQSSLMFSSKARAHPSEALYSKPLLCVIGNIKLAWKNFSANNTLAYFVLPSMIKKYIFKLFSFFTNKRYNKLERLPLAIFGNSNVIK